MILPASGCAPVANVWHDIFPTHVERIARSVTIRRDEFGVPHISGPTDASVVFGLAYAQAEDNFWQVEEDLVLAIGRGAELHGAAYLQHDIVRAAFEVERLSREEYEREPPERRRLWDAYADGLNYYLATHPETHPRLIRHFEPWFVFAIFRGASPGRVIDGVRLGGIVATPLDSAGNGDWQPAGTWEPDARAAPVELAVDGSNAWAVAPSRTRNGHALIFQNPHVRFFGGGQRYEVELRSDEGWHVTGFAILSTPMPRSGHNEHIAWTHTNTGADAADAYIVQFDDPAHPLAYRYGDGWRQAVEWESAIRIRTDSGTIVRRFRFRKTHQGPVVARAGPARSRFRGESQTPGGRAPRSASTGDSTFAIRIARFEEGGSLQQWYAMSHANTLEAFRAALAQTAFPISNTMYADDAGNIMFVEGNAVPRRDPRFDWSHPVDGADPATEWQGYHTLDELPQLINPATGWLQNANSTPFLATGEGSNLDADAYPRYMAPEGDNERARHAREILAGRSDWTFEAWAGAGFDTHATLADREIASLVDEWERLGAVAPARALRLDTAVARLRAWDGLSTTASVPMTLFVRWMERLRGADTAGVEWPRTRALEQALSGLEREWGTAEVPWGEVNRLQRVHTSGEEPFDDDAPSLAVPGAPGWTGVIFAFYTQPGPAGKRRYGTRGDSWVGLVELGPRMRSTSIVTFGQSAHPDSRHFFDQAPLYARGETKQAWFWPEDVEAHARLTYVPGVAGAAAPATGEGHH